jgi:hypothetical protein
MRFVYIADIRMIFFAHVELIGYYMATLEAATQHIIDLAEQHGAFSDQQGRRRSLSKELKLPF